MKGSSLDYPKFTEEFTLLLSLYVSSVISGVSRE